MWRVEEGEDGGACFATAAITADAAIFSSRGEKVISLARGDGKPRWTFKMKGAGDSSPVVSGNVVYVGSDDGILYGLDVTNGKKVWQFTAGAEIKASPAIARGRMVIGSSDGAVYCFGK